jgi:hypothetical protein
MEAIERHVRELTIAERSMIERLVGHALDENQKLVVHVVNCPTGAGVGADGHLPGWCHVYEGLTDQQITELEEIVLQRADLSC